MDNTTRDRLAEKMMDTLPKYTSWLSKLQHFSTPYGRLGLRPLGVLWIIRRRVIPDEELSPTTLAHYMDVQPSVITRALTRLEEDGYIERSMDLNDRRRITITLTGKGREVSVYAEDLYLRELARSMVGIDDQQLRVLLDTMDTLDTILSDLAGRDLSILDDSPECDLQHGQAK